MSIEAAHEIVIDCLPCDFQDLPPANQVDDDVTDDEIEAAWREVACGDCGGAGWMAGKPIYLDAARERDDGYEQVECLACDCTGVKR